MELVQQSPEAGLERVLALRASDLEGWESAAASEIDADLAAQLRERDVQLADLLAEWSRDCDAADVPDVRGSDFVGLPQGRSSVAPAALQGSARRRLRRLRPSGLPQALALAAGFALLSFGTWQVQQSSQNTTSEAVLLPSAGWKAVSGTVSTRVALQFSVERRLPSGALVEPGRAGSAYGAADSLILRVDLRGEPAWVYLFEQTSGGPPTVLHPSAGDGWRLEQGLHALSGRDGQPLAYRPDLPAGPTRYLAIATSVRVDAAGLATEVLASGLDRPDLWPRPVRAVDSFVVDWME
jgi:hypothetical protein